MKVKDESSIQFWAVFEHFLPNDHSLSCYKGKFRLPEENIITV